MRRSVAALEGVNHITIASMTSGGMKNLMLLQDWASVYFPRTSSPTSGLGTIFGKTALGYFRYARQLKTQIPKSFLHLA